MDIWDGENGEPVIYHGLHGRTLNATHVHTDDVLNDAIKPYAFQTSQFPLILSIENHMAPPQQRVFAKQLIDILGGIVSSALSSIHDGFSYR